MTNFTNPTGPLSHIPPQAVPAGIAQPEAAGVPGPHATAGDTEEVYYEGSPLMRGEIGRGIGWIFLGLLLIAGVVAWYVVAKDHQIVWWMALIVVVLGLLLIVTPFTRAKSIRYRITNYRIDFQRGLLSTKIDTLELWHVEDLRFQQSLLDRILGIGTITILSKHPTTPVLVMRSLPDARQLFTVLEQRVIAVKRQGSVVKVDPGT